jgi:16S rRNA (cytidine1402-2'-O)-methyltransferase
LPTDRFLFAGFLPARSGARTSAIAELAGLRASLVFYETGPRLHDCLTALSEGLGNRDGAVVREITKLHEECVTGTLADLTRRYEAAAPTGEIVIVIGPPGERTEISDEDLDQSLDDALESMSASRAAASVAEALGIPRKRVYARALERSAGR